MSSIKLSAVIALEKGAKGDAMGALTDAHHVMQKNALFNGLTRTYQPKQDDGDLLPDEGTKVQVRGEELLDEVAERVGRLLDITATKDFGNTIARADVTVNGTLLLEQVPVTYLLYLEKKLEELGTFLAKLPVLDPAEQWGWDSASNTHRAEKTVTVRTKKVPRNHVKAEATDRHPAQVEVYTEDIPVGYWTSVKFSGAFEQTRINELKTRLNILQNAVKVAREEANSLAVQDIKVSDKIFEFLGF